MTDKHEMDALLDDLFAEAKGDPDAAVSDAFMARMVDEALRHQPQAASLSSTTPDRGFWASLFDTIGGWQGTGGLMAATMASVFIGFSGAEALTIEGLQTVLGVDTEYYMTDLTGGFDLTEQSE